MNFEHLSLHELNDQVTKNLIGKHFEMLTNEFIENLQVFPCLYEEQNLQKITIENNRYIEDDEMHIIYDNIPHSNFNYLPNNFNIKNHLSRILCYYQKEWLYNHIIIGKLIEFDIFFYIVQEVDYEHFPNYTSVLFYTNSLHDLVSNCINYDIKYEILNDLNIMHYKQVNEVNEQSEVNVLEQMNGVEQLNKVNNLSNIFKNLTM